MQKKLTSAAVQITLANAVPFLWPTVQMYKYMTIAIVPKQHDNESSKTVTAISNN